MNKKIIVIIMPMLLSVIYVMPAIYKGKRSQGPTSEELTAHQAIQKQFYQLQQGAGIASSASDINAIRPGKGKQGTMGQFNKIRTELNTLLGQSTVNADLVKQKIN